MAQHPSSLPCEDVPLDEARRMGRGPRMEPMLYDTLRQKIQSLSIEATRLHLGPEIRPERMNNDILRMAHDLNVPVTVRRVPGSDHTLAPEGANRGEPAQGQVTFS
jgi:hypothetical protein